MAEVVELGIVSESGEVSFVEDGMCFWRHLKFSLLDLTTHLKFSPSALIMALFKEAHPCILKAGGFSNAVAPVHCNFAGSTSLAKVVSDGESTCITPYSVLWRDQRFNYA